MAGRIPSTFIDNLLARLDIVDVVERHVPLKAKGKDHIGLCPFHHEKTPSFTVNRERQFYYCFGCGAGGSAINFVMNYQNLDFVGAVEELAAMMHMEVPRDGQTNPPKSDPALYQVMQAASEFFQNRLRLSSEAVDYLKNRGLTGELAKQFALGYADAEWESLTHYLQQNKGFAASLLLQAGLSAPGKQKDHNYDRFRHRLIFPIRDQRGRCIAFGGRALGDDPAKYLNSPDTPLFNKSETIYGLFEARQQNRQLQQLIVVEGYMDVLALHQFGFTNAVATLGTATTLQHLQQLLKICSQLVFCFDGDQAGREAAWRAAKNALPLLNENRQLSFMFLSEGDDPDSYIRREGQGAFSAALQQALPYSEFFFQRLSAGLDLSVLDQQAVLDGRARPLINHMPEGTYRQLMLQHVEKLTGYKSKSSSTLRDSTKRVVAKHSGKSEQFSPVRKAVTLLLEYPGLASQLEASPDFTELNISGVSLLQDMILLCQNNPNISTGKLLEHWRESVELRHLIKLAGRGSGLGEQEAQQEWVAIVNDLLLQRKPRQQRIDELIARSKSNGLSEQEKSELNQLLIEKNNSRKSHTDV